MKLVLYVENWRTGEELWIGPFHNLSCKLGSTLRFDGSYDLPLRKDGSLTFEMEGGAERTFTYFAILSADHPDVQGRTLVDPDTLF